MNFIRSIRLLPLTLLALLVAAPAAAAYTETVTAPVMRGGTNVGVASAVMITTDTGWAIGDAKVKNFKAPTANTSWRTRTSLKSTCADPKVVDSGIDGEVGANPLTVIFSSAWKTSLIKTFVGPLATNDVIKQCPVGQTPQGSVVLQLVVQTTAGKTVGRAQLFAAG